MAQNAIRQDVSRIEVTANGVVAGTLQIVGAIVGVALGSTNTKTGTYMLATKGIFLLAKKTTDVVAAGALLYWDSGNSYLTTTASGNTKAGYAHKAAGNGTTTVELILANGI